MNIRHNLWGSLISLLCLMFPINVAQQPDPYNCPPETILDIPDSWLYLTALGKPLNGQITCGDMQSLTRVGAMITRVDLAGIVYAINLEELTFANSEVVSFAPLASLKKLTSVSLNIDSIWIFPTFRY